MDLRSRDRLPSSLPRLAPPRRDERPVPELTREDLVRLGEARIAAQRERRVAAIGLAALLVVAVAVGIGRGQGRDTRVTSGGPAALTSSDVPSTAAPTTTLVVDPSPNTTTVTLPLPTTAAAPTPTSAPAAPSTTVPVPATTAVPATSTVPTTVACRNSTDPACGPFRFDPQPGPDRPMTAEVTTVPAQPRAGQEVVIRVVLKDPDGVDYNATIEDYGDGTALGASVIVRCGRYGPWDPPARNLTAAEVVRDFRHTYAAAGTYSVRVSFDAGPFDCTDAVTGVGDRPYASSAVAALAVLVAP